MGYLLERVDEGIVGTGERDARAVTRVDGDKRPSNASPLGRKEERRVSVSLYG